MTLLLMSVIQVQIGTKMYPQKYQIWGTEVVQVNKVFKSKNADPNLDPQTHVAF